MAVKTYRDNLAIVVVIWVANLLGYYTVYFHLRYLEGDYFSNVLAFGGCEAFAYSIAGILTPKLGLRVSHVLQLSLIVLGALSYLVLKQPHPELLPIALGLASLGINWGCSCNWNGNVQIFPVIYAASTNGICNLFGRFASALAPLLAEAAPPKPMMTIMGVCLVGAALSVRLKVGKGRTTSA